MFEPGIASYTVRPERSDRYPGWLDRTVRMLWGRLARQTYSGARRYRRILPRIHAAAGDFSQLDEDQIIPTAATLRTRLLREGLAGQAAMTLFALVREVAGRRIGMRHFDTQLLGGWAILQGRIAEMETGEGKTLTATLPASVAAIYGMPVHVVSVNDYLTRRDCEAMRPVYEALGLRVGYVVHDMTPEEKRRAYACDITYCTNKDLAFDYLRDVLNLGQSGSCQLDAEVLTRLHSRQQRLLLRGLHFAIVDEADSILIDEARTPLIISKEAHNQDEERLLREAMKLSYQFEEGSDYQVDQREQRVTLTDYGREKLRQITTGMGPMWRGQVRREELLTRSLSARWLFRRDEHYLIRDGKIQIIDPYTGRVMADRSWERGLHQLIEIKEGCEVTSPKETLARISYQRFFRRYLRLAGMTGTAREVANELWSVYGLGVVRIPTHKPSRRIYRRPHIHPTDERKWQHVVQRVRTLHEQGVPVLIGTRSLKSSEEIGAALNQAGLDHQILNARQDADEAEIVARAGEPGRITVATNMAGRGTDIKLHPDCHESGLHVLIVERHEAGRVDRQLAGRCARQGDPGCVETILSFEDGLLRHVERHPLHRYLMRHVMRLGAPGRWLALRYLGRVQRRLEKYHARVRRDMLRHDYQYGKQLSFTGKQE